MQRLSTDRTSPAPGAPAVAGPARPAAAASADQGELFVAATDMTAPGTAPVVEDGMELRRSRRVRTRLHSSPSGTLLAETNRRPGALEAPPCKRLCDPPSATNPQPCLFDFDSDTFGELNAADESDRSLPASPPASPSAPSSCGRSPAGSPDVEASQRCDSSLSAVRRSAPRAAGLQSWRTEPGAKWVSEEANDPGTRTPTTLTAQHLLRRNSSLNLRGADDGAGHEGGPDPSERGATYSGG